MKRETQKPRDGEIFISNKEIFVFPIDHKIKGSYSDEIRPEDIVDGDILICLSMFQNESHHDCEYRFFNLKNSDFCAVPEHDPQIEFLEKIT